MEKLEHGERRGGLAGFEQPGAGDGDTRAVRGGVAERVRVERDRDGGAGAGQAKERRYSRMAKRVYACSTSMVVVSTCIRIYPYVEFQRPHQS